MKDSLISDGTLIGTRLVDAATGALVCTGWRSGIAGDGRIWATLLDADGLQHSSKAEAERLAAAAQQQEGQA